MFKSQYTWMADMQVLTWFFVEFLCTRPLHTSMSHLESTDLTLSALGSQSLVFQFSWRSVWSVFKWCLMVSPLLNLYPYPLIAVIWFSRFRPLQKSRRDSKSSWYMIHIVETWAMALEWCLSHMHWILDEFLSALWQALQYSCGALRIFLQSVQGTTQVGLPSLRAGMSNSF